MLAGSLITWLSLGLKTQVSSPFFSVALPASLAGRGEAHQRIVVAMRPGLHLHAALPVGPMHGHGDVGGGALGAPVVEGRAQQRIGVRRLPPVRRRGAARRQWRRQGRRRRRMLRSPSGVAMPSNSASTKLCTQARGSKLGSSQYCSSNPSTAPISMPARRVGIGVGLDLAWPVALRRSVRRSGRERRCRDCASPPRSVRACRILAAAAQTSSMTG